jgi:anti-sigma factor NepR-like protein
MLDRAVQAQIGRLLRDVFADVADEPVPERFITLLSELGNKSKEKPR